MKKVREDCRHGPMAYLANDVYIGRAFEEYGEANEIEVAFLCSLLTADDVVVDVGANVGTHAIPFAKVAKKVYAFEPQVPIYDVLVENVALNGLEEKVEALNVALGAADDNVLSFGPIDYAAPNNFGGFGVRESLSGTSVQTATLDGLALERVALIKVDVEGFEAHVIEGARATITRDRPLLYVENDRAEKSPALIDTIQKLGYRLYWHLPPLFNPRNHAGRTADAFPGVVAVNMLCVPRGQSVPQTAGLREVAGPRDAAFGVRSPSIRPPNGWAGIARFGGIGDNLMAASAAWALKRKGLKVEVITSSDCAWQVFEHNPNVDKLSIKTKSELPVNDMLAWQKWFKGRADEYDVFAHLSHSCEGILALFTASTQFYWPADVRRKLCDRSYLELIHDIAGCPYEFGPLFYASQEERAQALATKALVGPRAIAWCLSGTRYDKMHPYTPGIIARIIKEVGVPIVMLGRPGRNFDDARMVQQHVRRTNGSDAGLHLAISSNPDERGVSAIDWPVRRTLAFAQACDVVIGPDTGIMWGVAFEPMPKVLLLSHASPENISKYWLNTVTMHADPTRVPCWPCHRLHDSPETCTPNAENTGAACMTDITVEDIVATVEAIVAARESMDERKRDGCNRSVPHAGAAQLVA